MERQIVNTIVTVLVFLMTSAGIQVATAQSKGVSSQIPPKFQAQLGNAMQSYFEIRNALVQDNVKSAAAGAKIMSKELAKLDTVLLPVSQRVVWKKQAKSLNESVQKIQNSIDLASQRSIFYALSTQLTEVLKDYGPLEKTLYRQHCPMAFGSKGGDWLSDSKDILNPYLGTKMPKCGIIKETFGIGR